MKKMLPLLVLVLVAALPSIAEARPGALDPSFGTRGKSVRSVSFEREPFTPLSSPALARLQGGGSVVLVGNSLFALRADGGLDRRFGGGKVLVARPPETSLRLADVAVDPKGRVLVVGTLEGPFVAASLDEDAFVARYNPDGTLDSSFAQGGVLHGDFGMEPPTGLWWPDVPADDKPLTQLNGIALEPDGRIVLGGVHVKHIASCRGAVNYRFREAFVARISESGVADPGFGRGGAALVPGTTAIAPPAAVPGPSEALYLMDRPMWGECDIDYRRRVSRMGPTGALEGSMQVAELGFGDLRNTTSMALDRHGRILIAEPSGEQDGGNATLVRRLAGGSLDRSFGRKGVVRIVPDDEGRFVSSAIRVDRTGKIVVAGALDPGYEEEARELLVARLTPRGALDRRFGRAGKTVARFGRRAEVGPPDLALVKGGVLLAAEIKRPSMPGGEGIALARYLSR